MIKFVSDFPSVIRAGRAAMSVSSILVLSFVLTACGGGGGGSSSGGGGGSDSSSGVRVLHAAIDALPVDVLSSAHNGPVTSKVYFADSKSYRRLTSGPQSLSLVSALNTSDVVASFDVTSSGSDTYSILLYGSLNGNGLRAKLLKDSSPEEFSGALVRFVHGVTGASAITVNATGSEGPQQVSLGAVSEYIPVTPGSIKLTASRAADGSRLVAITETLEEGRAYTVLVAGETGYYTKGVLFRDR